MLDLGACKGENLEFFLTRGHVVDFASFFEPDHSNFVFLAEKLRTLRIDNSLVLPLAAWDETKEGYDFWSNVYDSADELLTTKSYHQALLEIPNNLVNKAE
jgi:hypothetical protein